jgi:gamma-glutamyltranspeptidase/glutathione hydrolase
MPSSFYPRAARPGTVARRGPHAGARRREALRRRGHTVEVGEEWSEGRLSACAVEPTAEGTVLKAGANPRGMQGYAIGR